ncbi:hypothetical protein [Burkholderia pyrrocinia]|uniref:hypothetical protein n=1 Tax=Burkholderia pyrrocinia TaxID=60550 RepID=UPI00104C08FE|nr:hypothetical protein [Burkholderia pyrrocinia]TDA48287.1 hypothetical protein EVG18_06320 [Burkholderia pyrrocinia]
MIIDLNETRVRCEWIASVQGGLHYRQPNCANRGLALHQLRYFNGFGGAHVTRPARRWLAIY